jgi:hypothetical protein
MKRTLSIIITFIALTNIVGFMPLYFSALQEIKSEVNLKLANASNLQKLIIPDAEYSTRAIFAMCDENEFQFKGQMYDYTSMKKVAGGYMFYVIEDNKESNLIDFIKSFYGQSNESGKSSKTPITHLLKNFSKDFVGSFSKKFMLPLSSATCLSFCKAKDTCPGYFRLIQNPPDSKYS